MQKFKILFFLDEEGQGLVEYSLVIALIALVVIGGLMNFQNAVGSSLGAASTAIDNAMGS